MCAALPWPPMRRYPMNPSPAKPSSIIAQVDGSGTTGVLPWVVTSRTSVLPTAGESSAKFTSIEVAVNVRDTGRKSTELPESTVTSVIGRPPAKVQAKPLKTSLQGKFPVLQNGLAKLLTMVIVLAEV